MIEGGCLCGSVRYRSNKAPTAGAFCHCRICQRAYGVGHMAGLRFDDGAEFTKGTLTYFRSSPVAKRGFCAQCGAPIVFLYDEAPDVWVMLGSLDRPEDWPMTKGATWGSTVHTQSEYKIAWEQISDGLPEVGSPFRDAARANIDKL